MGNPRALIIGGSLGGLFAANLLRKIGWDVDVYERSATDLSSRGAGIGGRDDLFALMRHIGVELDTSMEVEVESNICVDRLGKVVCQVAIPHKSTAWDRLYHGLKRVLPKQYFHAGASLDHFEQDEHGVTAFLSDGSQAWGDILIGADGVHSTVRRQLMPDAVPRYSGYVAWRAVLDDNDRPQAMRDFLTRHMVFCFPEGEQAFSVPMAPAGIGKDIRSQFVWFRPTDFTRALPDLCTDKCGVAHGVSIAPPLIRADVIANLKRDAEKNSLRKSPAW